MGNPLRDSRKAAELAAVGQLIEINDKVASFSGLATVLEADLAALAADEIPSGWRDRKISGELKFGFADSAQRFPMLSGRATVDVDVVCQRCLVPFRLQLCVEPELLLLDAEETADGFDGMEVWELDEPAMRPSDILEELLIMALPFSAMHGKMAECKAFGLTEAPVSGATEELVKPFADLRSQLARNEKDPVE